MGFKPYNNNFKKGNYSGGGGGYKKPFKKQQNQESSTPIWAYTTMLDTSRNGELAKNNSDFKLAIFINNENIGELIKQLTEIAEAGHKATVRVGRKFNEKLDKPTNYIFVSDNGTEEQKPKTSKYANEDEEEEEAPKPKFKSMKEKLATINSKKPASKYEPEVDEDNMGDDEDE